MNFLNGITEKFSNFVNSPEVQSLSKNVCNTLSELVSEASKKANVLKQYIPSFDKQSCTQGFNTMKSAGVDIVHNLQPTVQKGVETAKSILTNVYDTVVPMAQQAYATAKPVAKKAISNAIPMAKQAYEAAKPVAQQAYDTAKPVAQKVIDNAVPMAKQAYNAAKPLAQQAFDAAKPVFHKVAETAKPIYQKVADTAKTKLADLAVDFIPGLNDFFKAIGRRVVSFLQDFSENFMKFMDKIAEAIRNLFKANKS